MPDLNVFACTSIGVNQGILSDWAAAKQGCGAGGQMNNILSKKDHIDEYKNIFVGDFNIAWQVIKNNEFLLKDKLLAELCMSISGTIVSSKLGEKRNITFYPSKINTELVKVLMNGGSSKIYGCSEYSKCVSIRTKHVDIESAKALINKVRYTITAIMEKAIADIELSVEEKNFVENTKIPIYKVVNILSAYKQNMIDLRDFVDIISVDYLYKYIVDILNIMLDGALNLSMVQVSESDINKFIEYNTKNDTDEKINEFAEYEMIGKLTDEQLAQIIMQKFYINNVSEISNFFKNLNKENLEQIIAKLKNIKGTNKTQVARVIRVGRSIIEKIWKNC